MSNWQIEKYLTQPKTINKLISTDAIVIFDTNVLLAAYQWRKVTLKQIREILGELYAKGRLKFSLQTIKEFSTNKNKQIQNRINDIDMEINKLQSVRPVNELVPIMEDSICFNDAISKRENYVSTQVEYKKQLKDMKKELTMLFSHDDFLIFLKSIAKDNIISFHTETELTEFKQEANKRFSNKIPPGYNDAGKDSNNYGDYIIWKDILSLNKDIIFVSGDVKKDWVDVESNGTIYSSNLLLIQEFLEKTKGKNFVQTTPQEFIRYWNPNIEEKVVDDVSNVASKNNINRDEVINKLRNVGLSHFPGLVTEAVFNIGPEEVILMNDIDLRVTLDEYFMKEMISLNDMIISKDDNISKQVKDTLTAHFDLVNYHVSDGLLDTARGQAKEYLSNLLISSSQGQTPLE